MSLYFNKYIVGSQLKCPFFRPVMSPDFSPSILTFFPNDSQYVFLLALHTYYPLDLKPHGNHSSLSSLLPSQAKVPAHGSYPIYVDCVAEFNN